MSRFLSLFIAVLLAGAFLTFGIAKEVPLGYVKGKVVMEENKRPLARALVSLIRVDGLQDEEKTSRYCTTDSEGNFRIRNLPAGTYRLDASAKEHSLQKTSITVTEGKETELDVRLSPNEPYLKLYTSQKVYTPDEKPVIEVHGFVPQDSLAVDVYKLDLDGIAKKGGIQQAMEPLAYASDSDANTKIGSFAKLFKRSLTKIKTKDGEGAFIEPLQIPELEEGLYYIECKAGAKIARSYLNITQIALVTKSNSKESLCYVTDIRTGKPVPGAKVLTQNKTALADGGTTDKDGLITVRIKPNGEQAVVAATLGKSTAICGMYIRSHNEGEGDGDEEDSTSASDGGRIFTYTDRPVYRPGDLVHFKSIVRKLKGIEYELPKPEVAHIEIRDPDKNLVSTSTAPLSKHGSFIGQFTTSPEAKPGVYTITSTVGGLTDHYFVNLAAYRKPDFSITIKPNKDSYVMGDKAKATLNCQYYFGGPVAGAKVNVSIYRSPIWWQGEDADDEDSEFSSYRGGDYNNEIETTTDANGQAIIEFPTRGKNDDEDDELATDYNYSISAYVSDQSQKTVSGNADVRVNRGNFNLSINLDQYIVAVGDTAKVDVVAKANGKNAKPIPNQPVQLTLGRDKWTNNTSEFIPSKVINATTGADGIAHLSIPIYQHDTIVLKATSKDDQGKIIRANNSLWVEGSEMPRVKEKHYRFSLKIDRKKYKVGEQLKAIIQTDAQGGTALVTVQSDKIYQKLLVPITSGATTFQLPVTKFSSPNAYVSVAYVRDKQFLQATKEILVERLERDLKVTVTPDRPIAKPGESVKFLIHTANKDGLAVPAEVSLGVVDESIYAVKPDGTDIKKGLFPRKDNEVETSYSFPEIYLDGGDKGGGNVRVRTKFMDTAAWEPQVITDAKGDATVRVTLPDNLTTWRATVVGASDDSAAGMAIGKIRVRKDLMIQLNLPQFLVQQDSQRVAMIVTNDTGRDADVNVQVDTTGLKLQSDIPKVIHVPTGQPQTVELNLDAATSGPASVTAKAWINGGDSDGIKKEIQVQPHARLETTAYSGEINTSAKFTVNVGANADKTSGRLAIAISPTVASGMVQSLDSLVKFPYGCVEQTLSRFLPAVQVMHTTRGMQIERPDLEKRVPRIAADGYARLVRMQHADGGWGWWEYDETDAFMTSWVLDGILRARDAGYPHPAALNVPKAVAWVNKRITNPNPKDTLVDRLYMALVLSEYGHNKEAATILDAKKLAEASTGELALAALLAHSLGNKPFEESMLAKLRTTAKGGEIASWPSRGDWWYGEEDTSLSLLAFATCTPNDPIVPKIVRYLMKKRGPEGWYSTRATALTISGLTKYLDSVPQSIADSELTIRINGKSAKTVRIDKNTLLKPDLKLEFPITDLQPGDNTVELQKTGSGTSYYSADLKQYNAQDKLPQIVSNNDLNVERHYYLLKAQRTEDGNLRLLPSTRPIEQAVSGDIIRCEITIHAKSNDRYILIEDPIPSNCRITERDDPGEDGTWNWWWSQTVIRDDRISFFANSLPKGDYKIAYTLRAESSGISHAMPTHIENMYDPNVVSYGGENKLEVTK